jgi:alpha-beta hydrolase superfamily lysophospholipase
MLPRTAALLALLPLLACAPVARPAGPPMRLAAIETPFDAPPLPWMPRIAYALTPGPPAPTPAGPPPQAMLVMADGARLPLRAWRPPEGTAPRFAVLALHGLGDHGGNYLADAGPILAEGGVLLYAYDQRGFGWTAERGYWPGTETLVADARAATALCARATRTCPSSCSAKAWAPAVAILAAPPGISGQVLTAPALWGRRFMPALMRWPLDAATRLIPAVGMPAAVGGIVPTDNLAALRRLGRDPLTLPAVRVDMAAGLVDLMDEAVETLPGCCRAPTLFLIGAKDRVMPSDILRRALREAPEPRLIRYAEGWHLLLRDRIHPQVARDILRFLEEPRLKLPAEEAGRRWLEETPP